MAKCNKKYKLEKELLFLQWPAYNTKFIPGTQDLRYKHWINKGITAWCVLIKEG